MHAIDGILDTEFSDSSILDLLLQHGADLKLFDSMGNSFMDLIPDNHAIKKLLKKTLKK